MALSFFWATDLDSVFLSPDLTKWLHYSFSSFCFESQSAAVVTPESNERLFIIIKWIDQRSLHVQKCNDIANEIVPLLPSQRSNYIVKGHGGLTEMGRFSMAHSWICLSCSIRILHCQIFFLWLLRRTVASSFPSLLLCKLSRIQRQKQNSWGLYNMRTTVVTVMRWCGCTLSSSVLITKKGHYLLVVLSECKELSENK